MASSTYNHCKFISIIHYLDIRHNYLLRNLASVLNISTTSCSLLQQNEVFRYYKKVESLHVHHLSDRQFVWVNASRDNRCTVPHYEVWPFLASVAWLSGFLSRTAGITSKCNSHSVLSDSVSVSKETSETICFLCLITGHCSITMCGVYVHSHYP